MIFAIGDVHGCADELRALLNKLPHTPDTTIVLLGDYIDRGPDSRAVIDTILELRERCHVVALMGNHEAMLLDYLDAPTSAAGGMFIYNGGSATLASYADDHGEVAFPGDHVELVRGLPRMFQSDHNVFVHAGLPRVPLGEVDVERDGATLMWTRGQFLKTEYNWGKVVVHGHTPVARVTIRPNRINIDTGCVYRGRLTALALPGETRFSVKWMHEPRRIVLRDPSGIREAHRFTGTVPVRVLRGERAHDFVTVDYSEFGMFLRALDPAANARFRVGERIEGVVGPDDHSPIAFLGIIVRERIDDRGVHYGVKLTDTSAFVATVEQP